MTTTTVTMAQVRQALADALKANLASDCQVNAYMLSNFTPPALMVRPSSEELIEYGKAMGEGSQDWYFQIIGYVGTSTDRGAQERLDLWIAPGGSESINAAVDADPTLGGIVANAQVQNCSAYQEYQRPDSSVVLGAEWLVYVVT